MVRVWTNNAPSNRNICCALALLLSSAYTPECWSKPRQRARHGAQQCRARLPLDFVLPSQQRAVETGRYFRDLSNHTFSDNSNNGAQRSGSESLGSCEGVSSALVEVGSLASVSADFDSAFSTTCSTIPERHNTRPIKFTLLN